MKQNHGVAMIDRRSMDAKTQQRFRRKAIKMRDENHTLAHIGKACGVHLGTVSRWLKEHSSGGMAALKAKQRGPRHRLKRKLTPTQEIKVLSAMTGHSPAEYNLPFQLWTSGAVQRLIKMKVRIDLSLRSVGDYMRRWGMMGLRAKDRIEQLEPEQMTRWTSITYPAIKAQEKTEGASIYWADEKKLREGGIADLPYRRGIPYASEVIRLLEKTTMLSVVNNQGKLQFMLYNATRDNNKKSFLNGLLREVEKRKLLLIVPCSTNRSVPATTLTGNRNSELMEVFSFPSSSVETQEPLDSPS
jgi:transposase